MTRGKEWVRCKAKSKRTGNRCGRPVIKGRDVCYHHGGKSLAGIASPTYVNGRYSKVMPTQLMDLHRQAQEDPELQGVRDDLALQTTLIYQSLEAMSRGEAGELWVQLNKAWKDYQKYKAAPDKGDPTEALYMVGFLIKEGYQEYMSRIELRQMLQERAKLVDAEGKRLERAQNSVRVSELLVVIDRLMEIINRNVSDRTVAGAIIGEFVALVGSGSPHSREVAG